MTADSPLYVILLIDPDTGDIEAYGPVDAAQAADLEALLRAEILQSDELGEVGLLVLPLHVP